MSSLASTPTAPSRPSAKPGPQNRWPKPSSRPIGDAITGDVVTKADIAASEAALRADVVDMRTEVANVRAELKTDTGLVRAEIGAVQGDIGSLEARLYRQLWLMAAGIVGLAVAPVKLLG